MRYDSDAEDETSPLIGDSQVQSFVGSTKQAQLADDAVKALFGARQGSALPEVASPSGSYQKLGRSMGSRSSGRASSGRISSRLTSSVEHEEDDTPGCEDGNQLAQEDETDQTK